jgi:hypothetical protein
MENKVVKTMIGAVALSGVALAGPVSEMVTPAPAPAASGDFCDVFAKLGSSVYEGGFINSVKFAGRVHLNTAYTEGDINNVDFDDTYLELRRLRIGTKIQFLNDFTLAAAADMNKDSARDDVSFGYDKMHELYLKYSFGNVGSFEEVALAYGLMKNEFTAEGTTSSNQLKTVERSVISNRYYGGISSTGVKLSGKIGALTSALGVFSTEADSDELSDWNHSQALYGSFGYECPCGGTLTLQLLDNDVDPGDDDRYGYDWAASLAYANTFGNWEFLANVISGEETNGDATSGVVLMPSTYIIADTLEFVARYEYATSDGDNLRLSRYASADGRGTRFEDHQALYAGLNYYICGHNAKLQAGVEYETADGTTGVDADATTLWLGFRTSF